MTQPFNIAIALRADAGQAKGTLADFERSLQRTAAETGKVKSALDAEAAAMEKVVAASVKAATAKRGLSVIDSAVANSALTQAIQQAAGTTRLSIDQTATAAQAARAPIEGFATAMAAATRELVDSAQASHSYRVALDDIRASYNPLFAASRQYEQSLERIADAERMGAISAREAATARERAAAQLAPAGVMAPRAGGAPGTWITGNLAAQGNDIMMMAMAGQNPLQLALQQGTQVSQVLNSLDKGTSITGALAAGFTSMLNPVSLLTIGLIAAGTFGIQALGGLIPKTKSFDDAIGDLSGAVSDYGKNLKTARSSTSDLAAEFGTAAVAAQGLARAMADIDRRRAMRGAGDAVNALQKDAGLWLVDPSWRSDDPNSSTNAELFDARRAKDRRKMRGMFGLDGSAASVSLIDPVLDAMTNLDQAKTVEAQVAAVEQLKVVWQAAAEARGGISKDEDEFLAKIIAAGQELAKLQALDENAAGKSAAKDIARDLERQAATQIAIAKYGQDSAAVRQLELTHQREITAAKLEDLGIAKDSAEWLKVMAGLQVSYEAEERTIRNERARAHEDQIAGLDRQRRLIGATTAEQLRANAVAEAELDIRNRSLLPMQAALEIERAIARAAAETALERQRAIYDLQTTLMTDALDAQIGMARDPLSKADLEGERERVRLIREGVDADIAAAHAHAVRARSLTEAINQSRVQIATISDEVSVRQQVAAQVASGTLRADEANAAIQRELQLRPLIAAAARAEGDEKRRLTDIVTGLRVAHEMQAAEERRQAQNDYLRGSAERIQQARLELALIGQTASVRARVLALVQAERDIRAQGLTGEAAEVTRRQARELVDLNAQIAAQGEAWKRVQGAGEAAIDAVLDRLKGGDLKGALAGMLDELNKGFFDLAVKNPLKNMLLGTNLGTIDDIGGLSGIWDRLTGKAPLDERAAIGAATTPVQAMQIAAAQVTITAAALGLGGGAAGLLAGLPGASGVAAANVNVAPFEGIAGRAGLVTGPGGTQLLTLSAQEIMDLKKTVATEWVSSAGDSQAQGIIDTILNRKASGKWGDTIGAVVSAKSQFSDVNGPPGWAKGRRGIEDVPLSVVTPRVDAVVDDWLRRRASGAASSIGHHLNYANPNFSDRANLGWINGLAGPVLGAGNAIHRHGTTPDLQGWRPGAFGVALPGASEAMTSFTEATRTATTDLGTFGSGMGVFGNALQGFANGGAEGAASSLIGSIGQIIAGRLGIPGFAAGGDHVGGLRVVGEKGPELEFTGPSRIVNAELTRQLLSSRNPVAGHVSVAPVDTRPVIQIVNNSSAQVTGEVQETTDARGQRQSRLVLSDAVAEGMTAPGGRAARSLRGMGVAPPVRRRNA